MIHVDLRLAPDPTYMGEQDCLVCGQPFEVDAVFAEARTRDDQDFGPVCPPCVEHLGKRNPKWCPTLEEFEEAKRRYPEPMYGYEPEDHIWQKASAMSFISREDFSLGG